MGCLDLVYFVVIMNGFPSMCFNASIDLRKRCPLSPFIFLLVAEGLSMLIKDAKRKGDLKGIRISKSFYISHLLFVDDIRENKKSLNIYYKASGMLINMNKSVLPVNELADDVKTQENFIFTIIMLIWLKR